MPLSNNTKTGAEIISKHSNIFRYGKGSGEGKGVKFSLEKKSSQLCKLQIHIFYSDLIHNFFFFFFGLTGKKVLSIPCIPPKFLHNTNHKPPKHGLATPHLYVFMDFNMHGVL